MGRLHKAVFGLLAAAAVSLAVVASASAALPEWGKCEATTRGKYSDAACTVKAEGKTGGYEWHRAKENVSGGPLSDGGTFVFETAAGKKIECTGGMSRKSRVVLLGSGASTPSWKINGCESEGEVCETPFAPVEGQINNNYEYGETAEEEGAPNPGWTAKLGFVEGAGGPSPVVGMSYKPKNKERLLVPIVCRAEVGTIWIGGNKKGGNAFISEISPVDEMTSTFTETLSESAPGYQSPTNFEGHNSEMLQAFVENHWEPVALVATLSFQVEEGHSQEELKAIP